MKQLNAARRFAGNTFIGFIVGLVCGLAIAVAVALFITKAPVPFIDKGNGKAPESTPITGAQMPDPNKPFYPKEAPAVTPPAQPPAAATGTPGEPEKKLSFYDLAPAKPAAQTPAPDAAKAAPDDGKRYLLQAGAFKSQAEAEAMKARLALLGFNATVSAGDKDGTTLYRVRIGPPARVEDMNRTRQTLVQNGIDASLVAAR